MRRLFLLFCAVYSLCVYACGVEFFDFSEFYSVFSQDPDQVLLMPDSLRITLAPGESREVSLLTRPEHMEVVWRTTDDSICTVEADGRITGVHEGECDVVVTHPSSGVSSGIHVRVKNVDSRIQLDHSSLRLQRGESALLRAGVTPSDLRRDIRWCVDDPQGCASVSSGGDICRVRGISAGTLRVSAVLPDGKSAQTQVEIVNDESRNGFHILITLMVSGGVLLLCIAAGLRGRADNE